MSDPNAIPVSSLSAEQQSFPEIMLFEVTNDSSVSPPTAQTRLIDAWPNPFPDGPIRLENGKRQGFTVSGSIGDKLGDNSAEDDGYRFHDALHIGVMAHLGWSPVMRALLRVKRRGDPQVDDQEDGGRAIAFEEALFDFLGISSVEWASSIEEDIDLNFAALAIQGFTSKTSGGRLKFRFTDTKSALHESAKLFQEVRRNLGGYLLAHMKLHTVWYFPLDTTTYKSPTDVLKNRPVMTSEEALADDGSINWK